MRSILIVIILSFGFLTGFQCSKNKPADQAAPESEPAVSEMATDETAMPAQPAEGEQAPSTEDSEAQPTSNQ